MENKKKIYITKRIILFPIINSIVRVNFKPEQFGFWLNFTRIVHNLELAIEFWKTIGLNSFQTNLNLQFSW